MTLADYRAKYALYRSDKSLRDAAREVPDDHASGTTTRCRTTTRATRPAAGCDPSKHYTARAARPRLQGVLRGDAVLPRPARAAIYRALRFGKHVDLIMLDQRQYRDDQPCGDAAAPPAPSSTRRATTSARAQMDWAKQRLARSKARLEGGRQRADDDARRRCPAAHYYGFDSWQGYPVEREELLAHIKTKGIKDVVFITGDIHTFIAGDVRTQESRGEPVALEFVGGSITSQCLGETDLPLGGGQVLKGNDANPNTPPAIIDAPARRQPVGRPGRLRPPRLRPRQGRPPRRSTSRSSACRRSRRSRRRSCRRRASATRSPAARRRSRASTAPRRRCGSARSSSRPAARRTG